VCVCLHRVSLAAGRRQADFNFNFFMLYDTNCCRAPPCMCAMPHEALASIALKQEAAGHKNIKTGALAGCYTLHASRATPYEDEYTDNGRELFLPLLLS